MKVHLEDLGLVLAVSLSDNQQHFNSAVILVSMLHL